MADGDACSTSIRAIRADPIRWACCLLCDTLESTLEFPVCDDDVPDASHFPHPSGPGLEGEAHSPALDQFKSVA